MVNVWKITGAGIGPAGCNAHFFAEKSHARDALKKYREGKKRSDDNYGDGPEKVVVKGREELASTLNKAMGYGSEG